MSDERLVPAFWWSEFVRSAAAVRFALDNTPKAMDEANIRNILAPGMQRVRESLGAPVFITSGYRSPEVNARVGGSRNSQHMQGLAADFVSPAFGTPTLIARYLMQHAPDIRFDQLIAEGQWIHVSFAPPGQGRNEVLTAHFTPSGVTYTNGIA